MKELHKEKLFEKSENQEEQKVKVEIKVVILLVR